MFKIMINNSIFYNNVCNVMKYLYLYCKKFKMCGYVGYWCNFIIKFDIYRIIFYRFYYFYLYMVFVLIFLN